MTLKRLTTTIIAHRGARSLAPENTLAAARKAFETGADLWETDIAVTKDEHLILFHDDSLKRTTDAEVVFPDRDSLIYTEYTLAELQQLNPGARFLETDPFHQLKAGAVSSEEQAGFKTEKIPTLEQALLFTLEHQWKVNLELKALPERFKDFPVAERVVALIKHLNIDSGHIIISSFNHQWLRQVQVMEPDIEVQALVGLSFTAPLDFQDYSFDVYNARSTLIHDHEIAELKKRGKRINLFTVNEIHEMIKFIETGVEGFITDFPQHMVSYYEGAGKR